MGDYILGIVGIAVSVGLFLIGYRQTIGAKKERVNSANGEIEKILVRRIVLEAYTPKLADVSRLIEGKARDFHVRATDLLSEEQLLNSIFTRVVETDLIPKDQREEILKRLAPVLVEAEGEPVEEKTILELPSSRRRFLTRTVALAVLGIITSLIGSLVAVLPDLSTLGGKLPEILPAILVPGMASLAVITALIWFYRLRESQEETSKSSALWKYVKFEREVAKVLERVGPDVRAAGPRDVGYDFVVDRGGRKILIEVKAWNRPMPARIVMHIAENLRRALQREQAAEGIIVTQTAVNVPDEVVDRGSIRIMTLRDLRNYLAHGTT